MLLVAPRHTKRHPDRDEPSFFLRNPFLLFHLRPGTISTAPPLATINLMSSSQELNLDSSAMPAFSLASSLQDSICQAANPKHLQQLDRQTKTKTLNEELTHCESDLRTHMDEVTRLEYSLAGSEKNCTCNFKIILRIPAMTFLSGVKNVHVCY